MPKNAQRWGAFLAESPLLSSVCSISTLSFDFAHLPCPPKELHEWGEYSFIFDPAYAYALMLALPSDVVLALDPAWSTCGFLPGWDLFTTIIPYDSLVKPTSHAPFARETAQPGPAVQNPPVPTAFAPRSQGTIPEKTKDRNPASTTSRDNNLGFLLSAFGINFRRDMESLFTSLK
ncbi:MAG: hypothetical protein MMC23_003307 [Stictis urceolatum]|nr:hypothetical protein [Stictis urceolata]